MANILQKICLPKNKLSEIDQQHDIMQIVKTKPATHYTFVSQSGAIVHCFTINTTNYNIRSERTFNDAQPEEHQIQYSLRADNTARTLYATHSNVDKFAKHVYKKLYRTWLKNKEKVK